ncbi:histidine kinase [Dactylosporangium fulvum]|uniref:histidine kinase n=1 Tax=Dactylosporangium fulvum TaxID=53359 RepID=A0ABY5VRM2_9ACTN|nr:sensor histidine kinase [Dactylosporangium fulvum]UWP79456.1 sensor histidine kinase [Dactylosporangium fulvum]
MRASLRNLWAFLAGPDPAVHPRTRVGRALPFIGAVAAVFCGLISYEYLHDNTGSSGLSLTVASIVTAAPVAFVAGRPLLAWRVAWLVAVYTGITISTGERTPWPWQPVQILSVPVILGVVAVRHRRGVLVWVGVSALLLIFAFVNPNNVTGLILAVLAILVIGDQVRRRREAQRALAEEEERSELAQARRAVAEERNRIAREMHDVVAHHMSLIAVRAETAVYRIEGVPPAVADELAAIAGTSREALAEMRRLLGVLRVSDQPPPTEPQPVLDDLAGLVRDAREAGVEVTFEPLPGERVPPAVGLAAFRIVQEALSNARRHAAGAPVLIRLTRADDTLGVFVHNGPGADGITARDGHGLLGMRERAAAVGGTLEAGPVGDGYLVRATLPLDGEA